MLNMYTTKMLHVYAQEDEERKQINKQNSRFVMERMKIMLFNSKLVK